MNCVNEDVDVVITDNVVGPPRAKRINTILLGKCFWDAKTPSEQQKMYFFKYLLDRMQCYVYGSTNVEGTVLFVMEKFFEPYHDTKKFLEEGSLSFEEYTACCPRSFSKDL